ncbi:MAG: hypothetical protein ACI4J7_11270 [Ruminiclostridium sp.]
MDRIDLQEKVWGFIFGLIAIIASISEMIVSGISVSTVLGAIKDVSGTLVVVVVFYLVVKNMPHKPRNVTETLEKTIDEWGLNNAPLIFKTEGYVPSKDSLYSQGFVLLQDPKSYPTLVGITPESANWVDYAQYKSPKKLTGKFLDMPDYKTMTSSDFSILFVLEQKHFQNMDMQSIIDSIVNAVNRKYENKLKVDKVGSSSKFTIKYKRIVTTEDIEMFRNSLEFIMSLVKVVI